LYIPEICSPTIQLHPLNTHAHPFYNPYLSQRTRNTTSLDNKQYPVASLSKEEEKKDTLLRGLWVNEGIECF
jgi:hypothetical protein